jgi:hypothetical protein
VGAVLLLVGLVVFFVGAIYLRSCLVCNGLLLLVLVPGAGVTLDGCVRVAGDVVSGFRRGRSGWSALEIDLVLRRRDGRWFAVVGHQRMILSPFG